MQSLLVLLFFTFFSTFFVASLFLASFHTRKVLEVRTLDPRFANTNDSELAAFVGYAQSFPNAFLALVDTYDTLRSGLENFIVVALSLASLGYTANGVRLDRYTGGGFFFLKKSPYNVALLSSSKLENTQKFGVCSICCRSKSSFSRVSCFEKFKIFICYAAVVCSFSPFVFFLSPTRRLSGDLAYLSKECRTRLDEASKLYPGGAVLAKAVVVASNDINEEVLVSLNAQGHAIDAFGIGTHLVTCQAQPALG